MKRSVVVLLAVCCALSALSLAEQEQDQSIEATVQPAEQFATDNPQTNATTKAAPKPTKASTNATTKAAPKTTKASPNATTKAAPKTTKASPNATTKATPKTTKASPNATTKATPKTTKASPNATTKATPKTTKASPTTKPTTAPPPPGPTPAIKPSVGNYTLRNGNDTCVKAQIQLQIRLQTPQENGTFIVQPGLTKTEGECKGTKANLTLVFKEGFITFLYNKSVSNDTMYVNTVTFQLSYPFKKGGNGQYAGNNKTYLFAARVGHSYSCRNESVFMGYGVYLDLSSDRMQAFNLTKAGDFGYPDPCPADQPDYRVAIAVGVTLLVLIVVVVVVYLLSRRKRTDGYQSL